MKKQTLEEQVFRIKGMMSLMEQSQLQAMKDPNFFDNQKSSMDNSDNSEEERKFKPTNPRIFFNNGGSVSIQASETHYSDPRDDNGPYSEMEVGFPSEGTVIPDEMMRYVDGNIDDEDFNPNKSVYGYVPVSIIKMMVNANGGIKTGELPPMVEVDEETNENLGMLASIAVPMAASYVGSHMNEEQTPPNLVSCSGLGVKSPGLCDKSSKRPVVECAKLGVKSIGYCFVDTKEPIK